MPILMLLVALLIPRVVIVLIWLFSNWLQGIWSTWLWPVLGFIFMPLTLLWYAAVQHWFGGHWTLIPIAGMVIAVLLDLAPAKPRRKKG